MSKKKGLVLTGGSARAAYQVGVLKGIAEISGSKKNIFPIISGVSAGALNAAFLGAFAGNFQKATTDLWDFWAQLTSKQVFRAHFSSLSSTGIRLILEAASGGWIKSGLEGPYLLDTKPLRSLITENIPFERLKWQIKRGNLEGISITAVSYLSGVTVHFYDGQEDIKPWKRAHRSARRTSLGVEHVLASSAIPIFFPPVKVDGVFMGDGGLKFVSPLSPAIHLGAESLVVLSSDASVSGNDDIKMDQNPPKSIGIADVAGTVLNALFLDVVQADLDRVERINRTLNLIPEDIRKKLPDQLKILPIKEIHPSRSPADFVQMKHLDSWTFKFLLKGIRAESARGKGVLSYLAFEPDYTTKLLELGYRDVMSQADELRKFLS